MQYVNVLKGDYCGVGQYANGRFQLFINSPRRPLHIFSMVEVGEVELVVLRNDKAYFTLILKDGSSFFGEVEKRVWQDILYCFYIQTALNPRPSQARKTLFSVLYSNDFWRDLGRRFWLR